MWRYDKSVVQRLFLKSDDLRKPYAREDLHVEDFFHGGLEFQERADLADPQIDDGDAAFQFASAAGQRHTVHGGGRADL